MGRLFVKGAERGRQERGMDEIHERRGEVLAPGQGSADARGREGPTHRVQDEAHRERASQGWPTTHNKLQKQKRPKSLKQHLKIIKTTPIIYSKL